MRPLGSLVVSETHTTETHVPEAHTIDYKGRGNFDNCGRGYKNFEGEERIKTRTRSLKI